MNIKGPGRAHHRVDPPLQVNEGYVLGLWLEKSSMINTASLTSGQTYFFNSVNSTYKVGEEKEVYDTGFVVRAIASHQSRSKIGDLNFQQPEILNISLRIKEANSHITDSNIVTIAVIKSRTEILPCIGCSSNIKESFNVCIPIEHSGFSHILLQTADKLSLSSSTLLDDKLFLINSNASLLDHKETYQFCRELVAESLGLLFLNVSVFYKEIELATQQVNLTIAPPITGLKISHNTTLHGNNIYSMKNATFSVTYDKYPFPLTFTWDFGEGEKIIVNENHLNFAPVTLGNRTITVTASYNGISSTSNYTILVKKNFYLRGSKVVATNKDVLFTLEVRHPIHEQLKMKCIFPGGTTVNDVLPPLLQEYNITRTFTQSGDFTIYCIVESSLGTTQSYLRHVMVYAPIKDVALSFQSDQRLFPKSKLTLSCTSTDDNVEYFWSSSLFDRVIETGNISFIKFMVNQTGLYNVSVTAKNPLFQSNETLSFRIKDPITAFKLQVSKSFVKTKGNFSVSVDMEGGFNNTIQYQFLGKTFYSKLRTYSFNASDVPGNYPVNVTVLSENKNEKCYHISNSSCSGYITIEIIAPVQDFRYIIPNNSNIIHKNGVFYIREGKAFDFQLRADGTNVKFTATLPNDTLIIDSIFKHTHYIANVAWPSNIISKGVVHNVLAIASNRVSSKSITIQIQVEREIQGIRITGPKYVALNSSGRFMTNISGTNLNNVQYQWMVGTTYLNSSGNELTYFFDTPGVFNMSVIARNLFSSSSSYMQVSSVQMILGLYIKCPLFAKPNTLYNIEYGLSSGGLINLEINGKTMPIQPTLSQKDFLASFNESFQSPGENVVTIHASNPVTSQQTATCSIFVQAPIQGAAIYFSDAKSYALIEEKLIVMVENFKAINVTGHLDVSDASYTKRFTQTLLPISTCANKVTCQNLTTEIYFLSEGLFYIQSVLKNPISTYATKAIQIVIIKPGKKVSLFSNSVILGNATQLNLVISDSVSSVNCRVDYAAGEALYEFEAKPGYQLLEKYYSSVGDYNISVKCAINTRNETSWSLAHVRVPIEIEDTVSPTSCIALGSTFELVTKLKSSDMIFGISVQMYINQTKMASQFISKENSIHLQFNTSNLQTLGKGNSLLGGVANITLVLRNFASVRSAVFDVCLIPPIERIDISVPVVGKVGRSISFIVFVDYNRSYNLDISFGDKRLSQIGLTRKKMKFDHIYISPGTYQYNATASNNVSSITSVSVIKIVENIDNVQLVHDKYLVWPNNKAGFYLQFPGALSGNPDIDFKLYLGTDIQETFQPLDLSSMSNGKILLRNYNFEKAGCYKVTVEVRNDLMSNILKSKIEVLDFTLITVDVESAYSDKSKQKSKSSNHYHASYPILFSITGGTPCYQYRWLVTNLGNNKVIGSNNETKPKFPVTATIGNPGEFKIQVSAFSESYSDVVLEKTIEVVAGVPDLAIAVTAESSGKTTMSFVVFVHGDVSTIKYLYWTFGDEIVLNVTSLQFKPLNKDAPKIEPGFRVPSSWKSVNFVTMQHTYKTPGLYNVRVLTENEISLSRANIDVLVSQRPCKRPSVRIEKSKSGPLVFQYKFKANIQSKVDIDCEASKKVTFSWKIYRSSKWEMENDVSIESDDDLLRYVFFQTVSSNLECPKIFL